MFVHQKWIESRLELRDEIFEEDDDYVTLGPEFAEFLWQPDPYFLNSKVAGEFVLHGAFPSECTLVSSGHLDPSPHNHSLFTFQVLFFIYA
jgi:glycine receptor alpha-2